MFCIDVKCKYLMHPQMTAQLLTLQTPYVKQFYCLGNPNRGCRARDVQYREYLKSTPDDRRGEGRRRKFNPDLESLSVALKASETPAAHMVCFELVECQATSVSL